MLGTPYQSLNDITLLTSISSGGRIDFKTTVLRWKVTAQNGKTSGSSAQSPCPLLYQVYLSASPILLDSGRLSLMI